MLEEEVSIKIREGMLDNMIQLPSNKRGPMTFVKLSKKERLEKQILHREKRVKEQGVKLNLMRRELKELQDPVDRPDVDMEEEFDFVSQIKQRDEELHNLRLEIKNLQEERKEPHKEKLKFKRPAYANPPKSTEQDQDGMKEEKDIVGAINKTLGAE